MPNKNKIKPVRRMCSWLGEKIFSGLIPSSYRSDSAALLTILEWMLIGLLIRLFFMPISTHSDLLSVYGRASLMAYQGWVAIPGLFGLFAHYIHAFFLLIFGPLLGPNYSEMFYWVLAGRFSASTTNWMEFIASPDIYLYRVLFLLKFPYLLFDFASAFLLLHIFSHNKKGGLTAFIFWMVNPVTIFVVYIFGRYESLAIFFILLSLFYAKKNKLSLALLMLGVSITIRIYPVILLLPFALILGKNVRQQVKLCFLGILPWLIMQIPSLITTSSIPMVSAATSSFGKTFFGLKFDFRFFDGIYVFVVGYFLLLFYTYFALNRSFKSAWKICLLNLLFFFAVCYFHPQYFMWLMPLLVLQIVEDKRFIGLYVIQVFTLFVHTLHWDKSMSGQLFMPINRVYFKYVPAIKTYIDKVYPGDQFILIFRSILTAVCFFMIYLIIKSFTEKSRMQSNVFSG